MKIGSVVKVVLGVAFAATGVWIFTSQVNVHEMLAEVRRTPLWKLAVVAALNPLTLLFRAWRWRYLLADHPVSSKRGLFPLVTIGFMVNNFLPLRIGEAVRAALLWKRNRFTIAQSIGSIVVERLLDVFVFAIFLFLPILVVPQLSAYRFTGMVIGIGLLLVTLVFCAYARFPEVVRRIAGVVHPLVPLRFRARVASITVELVSNLGWLFSPKKTFLVAILSLLTLFCQVAMLQILASGIDGFDVFLSMFGIAFAAIGAAIPGAPGYVGTLHMVMLRGFEMAGVPSVNAGAIVVLYHGIGYIIISLLGLFYFLRLKISMKDVRESGAQVDRKT